MILDVDRFSVVGDIHSETEMLKAVHESLPAGTILVPAGDLIHGLDTRGTLDYVLEHKDSIIPIAGNHDLMLDIALHARNPEVRGWGAELLRSVKYKQDTLRDFRSYGVESPTITEESIQELGDAMPLEHHKLIRNMPLYLRVGNTLIVHAGVTSEPEEDQLKQLDEYQAARAEGDFSEIPPQVGGVGGLIRTEEYCSLKGIDRVLNGHYHGRGGSDPANRIMAEGRRVMLAPPRFAGYNFVWNSWLPNEVSKVAVADLVPKSTLPEVVQAA